MYEEEPLINVCYTYELVFLSLLSWLRRPVACWIDHSCQKYVCVISLFKKQTFGVFHLHGCLFSVYVTFALTFITTLLLAPVGLPHGSFP